jgi:hypothetical protein
MSCFKTVFYLALLLFILFSSSCKKREADEHGPIVSFVTPGYNQSYNVFDNIAVTATVSDETEITFVSVSLVDEQYNQVMPAVSIPVTSPSMTLNKLYYVDNIHMESGTYYVMIAASDGTTESRTYQRVQIVAVPRMLKNIFVVSGGSSQTNFSTIDSAFTGLQPYYSFNGDFIGSYASSYFQQLYRCGNYTGPFQALDIEFNAIKFSLSPTVSANPYFTAFYSNEKKSYVSRYDGGITGYNYDGSIFYNASVSTGYYATKMGFCGDALITEEKDKVSGNTKLVTHFTTGLAEKERAISQQAVALCEKNVDNLFVFGNDAGQGVIQLFDKVNNNLWNPYPYTLPTGTILSALKIDENTYLIGHSSGTVLKYQYSTSSVTTYLTGYTAVQLRYDDLNNRLIVAEANKISVFDYSTAGLLHSVNSSETVLDVHLLYNR